MRTPRHADGFTTLDAFLGEEGAREAFQARPIVPREWFLFPLFVIDEGPSEKSRVAPLLGMSMIQGRSRRSTRRAS